ncbi:phospholipase D-like domain-containing protein [Halobaculum limi]|uniref:phospholipase D-like domain-containing protein n=1 Tax=Halobaculum limi TaxID=3031916 RepID=UPI0024053D26|nr:phospholipase D-like domain-containing protein [Halobaculum sp. YSMS11]
MFRRVVRSLVAVLVVASLWAGPAAGIGAASSSTDPSIVELLPNPVAPEDAGEYVRIRVPAGNWTVDDDESTVTVRVTSAETLLLTSHPESIVDVPPGRVVADGLSLSNAGERVVLRRGGSNGTVVDSVTYGRAPEGERWLSETDPPWRPVGFEPRDPVSLGRVDTTAFVLPDDPATPLEPIDQAQERILLAGYTFASERVTRGLVAANDRGVTVRVLVDGAPVGGISTRQARLLDRLVAADIEVRVVAGPHARVRYHHAKYVVADETAVVLTENWKPSGVGGASSRGWGVTLRSPRAADGVATVFETDAGWRDARLWSTFRAGRSFTETETTTGEYPSRHPAVDAEATDVTLLTAPGNAEAGVVSVVDDADRRVDVIQPTVRPGPLLVSTRRAAERGVQVRLLLSGAWYVVDENEALVATLNRWSDQQGVPFEARVADPAGRYGKIHAKGVVADDVAVVGSLNWNPTSATENREVVVAVESETVAEYYREVFEGDWTADGGADGTGAVPPLLGAVAVAAAAAVVVLGWRRIEFDDTVGRSSDGDGDDRGPIG